MGWTESLGLVDPFRIDRQWDSIVQHRNCVPSLGLGYDGRSYEKKKKCVCVCVRERERQRQRQRQRQRERELDVTLLYGIN